MTVISRLREAGFEVYTREDWGANLRAYAERAASSYYRVNEPAPYHYLHITVTPDTDTRLEGFAGARRVESYGLSTPPQVSYQMLVSNEAKIFEGQNYGVKGTHTVNDKKVPGFPEDLNRYGYAVAIMQNVQDEVTDEQVVAIAACFAAAELEGHVKRGAPIFPHRKFDWKECPGDKAVARLPEIQRLKDAMVKAGSINKEDDVSAEDVWKYRVPVVVDGASRQDEEARFALARARRDGAVARAEARAAAERAERAEAALSALATSLEGVVPGVKQAVLDALGDEIKVRVEIDFPGEEEEQA